VDETRMVGPSSLVRVRESGRAARTVRIRDWEAWTPDGIEADSPLGRALMGRHVGDEVEVRLADSLPVRRVKIEAIE
jgi:transcription elongation GreA/GreB family factor